MSESPNGNGQITHSWLQNLQDRIDSNHREVMAELRRKSDTEDCAKTDKRVETLEKHHNRLLLKVTGLTSFLMGSGVLVGKFVL